MMEILAPLAHQEYGGGEAEKDQTYQFKHFVPMFGGVPSYLRLVVAGNTVSKS
jgi:hypothetical protein